MESLDETANHSTWLFVPFVCGSDTMREMHHAKGTKVTMEKNGRLLSLGSVSGNDSQHGSTIREGKREEGIRRGPSDVGNRNPIGSRCPRLYLNRVGPVHSAGRHIPVQANPADGIFLNPIPDEERVWPKFLNECVIERRKKLGVENPSPPVVNTCSPRGAF